MTSQSPRIYTYKITFEEVPYYYYGVHKEKRFNEEYWGSPVTHKWCWELYTPKKQILELFEFSDIGYIEAQEVEKRLIKPVYNTDKWCLNENCGGIFSLAAIRRNYELGIGIFGISKEEREKIASSVGKENYNLGRGIFKLTTEQLQEMGRKNHREKRGFHAWSTEERKEFSKRNYENGKGFAVLTKEQLRNNARKNYENGIGLASISTEERRKIGRKNYENKVGIHRMSKEERMELAKKRGKRSYELKVGIHGLTTEERKSISKRAGKIGGKKSFEKKSGIHSFTPEQRKELGRKTSSQRWMCLETGYISTPAGLANYQRRRGIDTSKKIKLE